MTRNISNEPGTHIHCNKGALDRLFSQFGVPETAVEAEGEQFSSAEFGQFLSVPYVQIICSVPCIIHNLMGRQNNLWARAGALIRSLTSNSNNSLRTYRSMSNSSALGKLFLCETDARITQRNPASYPDGLEKWDHGRPTQPIS